MSSPSPCRTSGVFTQTLTHASPSLCPAHSYPPPHPLSPLSTLAFPTLPLLRVRTDANAHPRPHSRCDPSKICLHKGQTSHRFRAWRPVSPLIMQPDFSLAWTFTPSLLVLSTHPRLPCLDPKDPIFLDHPSNRVARALSWTSHFTSSHISLDITYIKSAHKLFWQIYVCTSIKDQFC